MLLVQGVIFHIVIKNMIKSDVSEYLEEKIRERTEHIALAVNEANDAMSLIQSLKSFENYIVAKEFDDAQGITEYENDIEAFLKVISKTSRQYKTITFADENGDPVISIAGGKRTEGISGNDRESLRKYAALLKGIKTAGDDPAAKAHHDISYEIDEGWELSHLKPFMIKGKVRGILIICESFSGIADEYFQPLSLKGLHYAIFKDDGTVVSSSQGIDDKIISGLNKGDMSGMIVISSQQSPPELKISFGVEKSRAYAVLEHMFWVNLGILCFAGILSMIFLGVIARNISSPIVKLKEWAIRLSNGNLAIEQFTPSNDEIGELNVSCARVVSSFQDIASVCESISEGDFSRTLNVKGDNDVLGQSVNKMITTIRSAQAQILQQDKMASIGQLAAGVAHEINNPLCFIISNLGSLQNYTGKLVDFINFQAEAIGELSGEQNKNAEDILNRMNNYSRSMKLDFIKTDISGLINESLDGANRLKKIVQDLKSFSRVDEVEFKTADINSCLDSTINIAWNELKYKATLRKEYGDVPQVKCFPGQLNQVFLNILINAAQSIEKQGEIIVSTRHESDHVYVSISDTGCGIPEDKIARIFEPFFTTKEVGKGTGLGLSIVYDIVKKHKGDINVQSKIGEGTSFTIKIPNGNNQVSPD